MSTINDISKLLNTLQKEHNERLYHKQLIIKQERKNSKKLEAHIDELSNIIKYLKYENKKLWKFVSAQQRTTIIPKNATRAIAQSEVDYIDLTANKNSLLSSTVVKQEPSIIKDRFGSEPFAEEPPDEDSEEEVVDEDPEEEVVEEEESEEEVVDEDSEEEVVEEESEEEVVEEESEEEVYQVTIDGTKYYTTNEKNGMIYTVTPDGDVGDEVGYYEDGEAGFYEEE